MGEPYHFFPQHFVSLLLLSPCCLPFTVDFYPGATSTSTGCVITIPLGGEGGLVTLGFGPLRAAPVGPLVGLLQSGRSGRVAPRSGRSLVVPLLGRAASRSCRSQVGLLLGRAAPWSGRSLVGPLPVGPLQVGPLPGASGPLLDAPGRPWALLGALERSWVCLGVLSYAYFGFSIRFYRFP